jgi:hypothetical protein
MSKEDAASTYGKFGRVVGSVLTRPWIHRLEQRLMCIQNVLVAELLYPGELLERIVKAGCE